MKKASEAAGADRPALDRRIDPRLTSGDRGGSVPEVEAACRRVAEYLLAVSKDPRFEPALHEFMRTLERGRRELDAAARVRSEKIYEAVFRLDVIGSEGRVVRDRCDPYFWG